MCQTVWSQIRPNAQHFVGPGMGPNCLQRLSVVQTTLGRKEFIPFSSEQFDECAEQNGTFNDCSPLAWCLDTDVSYMCSCKKGYTDISPNFSKRPGRICIGKFLYRICTGLKST